MRRLLAFLGVWLCASTLWAQSTTNVTATDPSTGARTQIGDNTNHAIRANIVTSANITVVPSNTANTTPWLFSISQGGNTAVVNASGQLSVVCANCSGSGVSQVDNTGFVYGTTVFVPTGGVYNSTITNLTSGDAGAAALTINRKLHIALFDSAGTAWTQNGDGGMPAHITNGSTTVTDAATITTGQSSVALADAAMFGYNAVGTNYARAVIDPCEQNAQTSTAISMTSATTTRIVAPASSKKTYICGLTLLAGAADNVALVEGTGGTCGTGTAGVAGGTTAANGFNLAANGGFVWPAGKVAHAVTAGTNVDLCLITSSTGPLTGVIKWVQQ